MASYQKRGKTWQYTVSRMVNGEPDPIRKGGFRTKKEAQVAAAEVEDKLRKGLTPHLTPVAFDKYFEDWYLLYKKPNVTKNTLTHYEYTLSYIKKHFKGIPIQNIKKRDYQSFLNKTGKNLSKETMDKFNAHIRACIREAIDEQIIHIDFTRNATVSAKIPAKKSEEKHLNYNETKLLLEELYKRLKNGTGYYLLYLGVTSGLRFGELVGLTKDDFDFVNNTISVNKTWGYLKSMHEGFGPLKNEQSNRIIKMDQETMNIFKKYINKLPDNKYNLIFYSDSSKYKVISNRNANKLLKKVLDDLDLKSISMHGLRHTHASVLLYKKVSIYYVSERLGHQDIQTTISVYSHVIKEMRIDDENNTINVFKNMTEQNLV